jgi:hypothetical protein
MPGRRFAFGGIFVGIIAASAGDIPMALKEFEVRYATKRAKDYKLTDGEGLYLLVRPNGSKLWRMKYRFTPATRHIASNTPEGGVTAKVEMTPQALP